VELSPKSTLKELFKNFLQTSFKIYGPIIKNTLGMKRIQQFNKRDFRSRPFQSRVEEIIASIMIAVKFVYNRQFIFQIHLKSVIRNNFGNFVIMRCAKGMVRFKKIR